MQRAIMVSDKARRLLVEGRLMVEQVYGDREHYAFTIEATCRGDSGEVYDLGWLQEKGGWWCSCPARTTCSHLKALMLVVVRHA